MEEDGECGLDQVIATPRDLYALKKRIAYLMAFVEFVEAKLKKLNFQKPDLNAAYLDYALIKTVKYVQGRCFGTAVDSLRKGTPDDFDAILRRLNESVATRKVQDGLMNLKR